MKCVYNLKSRTKSILTQCSCSSYSDQFDPSQRFGSKTIFDPRGIWVKCACEWHNNEPTFFAKKIQADFIERTKPHVGKTLAPYVPPKKLTSYYMEFWVY